MDKIKNWLDNKLPAGSFIRNVVTLMTGTTFAQALLILMAPILTRLYSPEDFGIYSLYSSIAAIITVFVCLSYELAIVLPEKDEDAANLLGLSILVCLIISGLTLVTVGFFRDELAKLLNAPNLDTLLWLIPLSVFGAGLFKALNYWSTRRKQFKRLAIRQITQSTITSVSQIGIGITPYAASTGLVGGLIIGQLAATIRLALQIAKDEGRVIISNINFINIKQVAIRYKKFPLYDSWSGLFNTASTMLPALLLGYFFSPAVVGFYALGQRVLSLPMGVIGGSIGQVFYPRATKADQDGELSKVTLEMFEHLLAIGLVPLMLVAIVAPDLFAIIFGERWWTAGQYVRWLSMWVLFQFISSPLSTIYYILEKQKSLLIFNLGMFMTRLLVLIIGGVRKDILLVIVLLGVTGAMLYALLCVHMAKISGIPISKIALLIFKRAILSMPYLLFPILVWYIFVSSKAFVLAAIISGLIFLTVMTYRSKKTNLLV